MMQWTSFGIRLFSFLCRFFFILYFFLTQRGWNIYHFSMGEGKKKKKKKRKKNIKSILGSRLARSRRLIRVDFENSSDSICIEIYTIYFLTIGKEKSDLRNIREFYCFFLFILGQIHWSTIWKWTGNVDTFVDKLTSWFLRNKILFIVVHSSFITLGFKIKRRFSSISKSLEMKLNFSAFSLLAERFLESLNRRENVGNNFFIDFVSKKKKKKKKEKKKKKKKKRFVTNVHWYEY